mmetsp:Transcript_7967/g.28020  ORF Transcript_7967/g.28020 Transcript_7967/m.28020 type:complete len:226 (-) Transcript_7967:326-1003(-)
MSLSTSRAAATSALARPSSASSTRSHASSSASPTPTGVPSFSLSASPDLCPSPPRKLNMNCSRSPNPLCSQPGSPASAVHPRPIGSLPLKADLAPRAPLALTGSTSAAPTPSSRLALSCTNSITSTTSPRFCSMSTLFSTKTTFLSHRRMYCRKDTSDSVMGRSALSTKSTRSALGMNSSVSRCWRSRMTLVPGVSTMFTCCRSSAGRKSSKWPSAARFVSRFSP